MRFLIPEEASRWAASHGFSAAPEPLLSAVPAGLPHVRVRLPTAPGALLPFCRRLAEQLSPRAACLLSVVTWGVWSSSENWHLYYRLRQSYGDVRLLHEAPGHLFLDYEESDLITFLHLTLLFGWDAHVLPALTYGEPETARLFVSHDEWVALASRDDGIVEQWRSVFHESGDQLLLSRDV